VGASVPLVRPKRHRMGHTANSAGATAWLSLPPAVSCFCSGQRPEPFLLRRRLCLPCSCGSIGLPLPCFS